jgi:hypothetical protein
MTLEDIITVPQYNLQYLKHLYEDWWACVTQHGLKHSMPKHELMEQETNRIISLLPDLSKFKLKIFEYTEFDVLNYHIEEVDGRITVAYRPKNVPVSFWTASFKDCEIIKEIE